MPLYSSPREMRPTRLLIAALAALVAASGAHAQTRLSPAPRVLFAASDWVKTNDGAYAQVETTVTYDPVAGEYVRESRADGVTLSRVVRATSVAGPTPAEAAASRRLIETHPEIAALIGAASGAVTIDGGFPLVREAGHACGPGGRCASYDVFQSTPDGRERIRYVVVDLRAGRVLDADADPDADSNLAHPRARRESRRY